MEIGIISQDVVHQKKILSKIRAILSGYKEAK